MAQFKNLSACFSYDITDYTTKEREVKALLKASEIMKCDKLYVITYDYVNKESIGGKTIEYLPMREWLLETGNNSG